MSELLNPYEAGSASLPTPAKIARSSGVARASMALAVVAVAIAFADFGYIAYLIGMGRNPTEFQSMMIGGVILLAACCASVGLVLGLAGLFLSGGKRWIAPVAATTNAIVVMVTFAVFYMALIDKSLSSP